MLSLCHRRVSSAKRLTALWKGLSAEFKSCGLLTNLDLEGVEAFVEIYSLYREALSLVRAQGMQIPRRDETGKIFGVPMNPAFLVAKHCLVTMNRFGADLGLSLAARSRIPAIGPAR
jgi:P27 family predicted phage terminase small subunit